MGSNPCPSLLLRGRRSPMPLALLLGRMLSGQNKDKQAEEVYRKALQDFGLSSDWDATATLLREYIRLVTRRGKFCEAKAIYYLVIRNFTFRLGRCHAKTLLLIYETGNALRTSGALSDAEQVYQEAIFDLDISMHKENDTLLCVIDELGVVYTQQGRWKDAENFHHAALKGFLDIYQNYFHLRVVTVVLNLGTTLREQGKLNYAAQMFQWGSSGLEQAFGLDHEDTINAFDQLALIHTSTQNFVDAEFALSSSLNGCESLYGKSHEKTLQKRAEIVTLLRDQGKFLEAQAACESLLSDCKTLGSELRFLVLNHLGTIHCMASRFAEAEEYFATALAGFREYEGQRSPSALLVLYNMGNTYLARGQPDLAESAYRQALAGLRLTVGHNHTASLAAAEMLGLSLMSQNIADAANTCSEALNLCKTEGPLAITEVHKVTAANFERMTTSRLPAYNEALLRWNHEPNDFYVRDQHFSATKYGSRQ
ncbi:TPR repeat protein [Akanthomyces lecanii RCEF 1005]|uniref:TPR repeat protein n=1 Tax=Akanthomyces lecanii RCEF 1005 TaxID=1081108 RepID=A0A167XM73_CORDF|nr:TPR repeat protein [Akanthomyces lecanii RCEF 1005]